MKKTAPDEKQRLALVRHEVICHIKSLKKEGIPLAECFRQASSCPWPEETGRQYSCRTIETWWYQNLQHGFAGLSGKPRRADSGKSRAIDTETGFWVIEAITENPSTPLSVLYRHWKKNGKALPSISSVLRFLAAHGYDRRSLKAGRLASGPTKAFEVPAPNDLWMVDFSNGPTLRADDGRVITTQLCVIIDDHSRLLPFAAYYTNGDTASFLDCLKQAVLRRGVPDKLYTDQGSPFINTHARIACANLGIRLLHAKPYHAWSKGKVERVIRTIQEDFEATLRLEGNPAKNLPDLNTAFSRWVAASYHLRVHGSTEMTPHERFNRPGHPLRTVEEPGKIDALFYTRAVRVVRKDGTVTLEKKILEVDLALRALKVELRYDPVHFDRVEVWHKDAFHGVARVADLHLNSQIQNRGSNYAR